MKYRYAVLGAGRQGIAAAYDLAKFGRAEEIRLIDINLSSARAGADRINKLLPPSAGQVGCKIAKGFQSDITNTGKLASILKGINAFISAAHYSFNPAITSLAIRLKCHMTDLGGNTGIVRKQLQQKARAKKAGVSIVPDCGMGPGLNISLAVYAMSLLDKPREVYIWDGGLPQNPLPPWNYSLLFSIAGLTNEYSGNAYFLRNGKITEVPCFEGSEQLNFPALAGRPDKAGRTSPWAGRLEAFVTSGGLSTAPWTFQGKLERLENKTLRYPGHAAQFKAFAQLGLLEQKPVQVGKVKIIPRDVFHTLLESKITNSDVRDIGVMRIKCVGKKNGRPAAAFVELIDYYDALTGFTAMQKLTGWHASIVTILAAQARIPSGVWPVELAVPGKIIVEEARRRGFDIKGKVSYL